jgi:hypothetical protein
LFFRYSIQALLLYYIKLRILIEDAYAAQEQRQRGIQNAAGVVAANVGVQAQVGLENNDIANCLVVTGECETE